MKKRLFISSILMTLVLLVAITTATFAWYSVSSAGINKSASGSVAEIKSSTDVSLSGQTVSITLARTGTESLALTKGDASGGTYKSVALINGNKELQETNANVMGTFTITLASSGLAALSQEQKAALDQQSFTATLTPTGNVVLLKAGTSRGDVSNEVSAAVTLTVKWVYDSTESSAGADEITYGHFEVTNNDDLTLTHTAGSLVWTGKFAVLPNNPSGAEYIHTDEIQVQKENADAGTPSDATADRLFPVGTTANLHESDALASYNGYHTHDGITLK